MHRGHRWAVVAGWAWLSLSAAAADAALPPRVGSPPNNADRKALSHLLASRMAAAWNARAAASTSQAPTVVIGDDWGNGKPPNLFNGKRYIDAQLVGGAIDNPQDGSGKDHGYHVTGIVFGSFANDGTGPGLVTGAFPKRGKLVPIDRYEDGSLVSDPDKFAPAIDAVPGRVVVNTSIGFRECVNSVAAEDAVEWINKVRALGLEDRVFHTASAGNEGQQGGSALCGSRWSAAATRTDLMDGGNPVAPLTNTLAVENVFETANASALECLDPDSNTDGSIAAPGQDVWSFKKSGGARNFDGTSMASPLVAGLAAYLWSIAPDLTPQQLSAAIRENADDPQSGCTPQSAPRLDAFAATLSLDQTSTPAPATWPVRFAILDKTADETFDQKDLAAFRPEVKPSLLNTKRDWSRFDLNGDGFTGGVDTAPFDLDRAGSTRAGTTSLGDVTDGNGVGYDEEFVSDADVLCFYAYSPLYTGSTIKRTEKLEGLCEAEGSIEDIGGGATVEAVCDAETVRHQTEGLTFSDTVTTDCSTATQNSTIVFDSSGLSVTGTGSGSASGSSNVIFAAVDSDVDRDFRVTAPVPWSISGTLDTSAPSEFASSSARVTLQGFPDGGDLTTIFDASHCSLDGDSFDCDGSPTSPPQGSFSDSGTLAPGQYSIAVDARTSTQDSTNSMSWSLQFHAG